MLKLVHASFALIVILLYSDYSNGLTINQIYASTSEPDLVKEVLQGEKSPYDDDLKENIEEPLEHGKDRQETEDLIDEDQMIAILDKILEHRQKRQVHNGYNQLYPQVPSAPPYNPYQPQPGPGQYPSAPPNGQAPKQWSPSGYNNNYSQPGYPSSQPGYPLAQPGYPGSQPYYQNQGPHNQYPPNGNHFRPPNGQNPQTNFKISNNTFNQSVYPGGHGQNFNNNSRPLQPPYNKSSNYPGFHHSSDNKHPVMNFNTTHNTSPSYPAQWPNTVTPSYPNYPSRPTYNNTQQVPAFRPSQQPSYNNSRPSYAQWPGMNPNYPGGRPSYNTTRGQYPYPQNSPTSNNGTNFKGPHYQNPYSPQQGQYPANPNNPSNTYNPSNPNYPHNNPNSLNSNYFPYPQNNYTAYDPRKVPPEHFNYH